MIIDPNYLKTAHLLRRAGFGAAPETIRAAAQQGLAATTDALLHPERTPDTLNDDVLLSRLAALAPVNKGDGLSNQAVKMWWVYRMIATPHPLVEKMTLFWHGHFTSKGGGMDGDAMLAQNQMFRKNALGNFRTLTLAVSRDPEMLKYLNGNQNFKAHPNENYGRELMELYTCGIGNYTEDDVKAAARAFSGWNLRGKQFYFNANQHDNDPKTFLGQTGNWNGNDIVDKLVAHPATARRLCTQLFTYLAYPNPEPAVLNALVKTYYESGYDIGAIVSQIFHSQAFYSDKAFGGLIKSPAEYVVGTIKMLGLEQAAIVPADQISLSNDMAANPGNAGVVGTAQQRQQGRRTGLLAQLVGAMTAQGQNLLSPPSVKGWDGNEAWINTATMLNRVNFANQISNSREAFGGAFFQAAQFVQQNNISNAAAWVDYLADTLGPLNLAPRTRQALIDYVNGTGQAPMAPNSGGAVVMNTDYEQGVPPVGPNQPGLLPGQEGIPPARRQGMLRQGRRYGAAPVRRQPNYGNSLEGRLRGVIPLMMATPEYQVS